MTIKELIESLESLELPIAYHQFKNAVKVPYCVYYISGRNDFNADNINYQRSNIVSVEFYTVDADYILIEKFETILDRNKVSYSCNPFIWIDEDDIKLYQTTYTFSVEGEKDERK